MGINPLSYAAGVVAATADLDLEIKSAIRDFLRSAFLEWIRFVLAALSSREE